MAAAGAGGGAPPTPSPENIHKLIESAASPLPAALMKKIATFVPNWRKRPEFNKFKNTLFHQVPHEIEGKVKQDIPLLLDYIDYLDSPEFDAARRKYGADRPAKDKQWLLDDLLCEMMSSAPFSAFKIVVDAGANINMPLRYPCFDNYPVLMLLNNKGRFWLRDGELKFMYLVEKGANINMYIQGNNPIDIAMQRNYFDEIVLLLRHGAKPTNPGQKVRAYGAYYLSGLIFALLHDPNIISADEYKLVAAVPAATMQAAVQILADSHGPAADILNRIVMPKYKKVRQLIAHSLGGAVAIVRAIESLVSRSARTRRSHTLKSLKGGKRTCRRRA